MFPIGVQENIFKIIKIFKNYEYMRKSIEELQEIKTLIINSIKDLDYYKNRPMVHLAFEHRKHIKNQEKFLESNMAIMTKEIYENCNYLKKEIMTFLDKLNMRVDTLIIGKIEFSEREKANFYQQLLNLIDENQIDLLEQLLNQNLIDLTYPSLSDIWNGDRVSSLMVFACSRNNLDIVKMFYNSHITINPAIEFNLIQGPRLLSIAFSNKDFNLDLIKYLLDNGTNVNIVNNPQYSPLHFLMKKLCENKIIEIKIILEWFFNKGFNPNITNEFGNSALHCLISQINSYKLLNPVTSNDDTICVYYIDNIAFKITLENIKIIIDLFIANDFDINLQNNNGDTILHECFMLSDNLDLIKYLLSKNPNVHIVNNWGKSVLQLAKDSSDNNILKLVSNYVKNI